ncbi:13592_t:CDS:2, partial [Entrophospora sp. SA101]
LTAILHWEQASEVAIEWASKAFAILQEEKKSQSVAKFWENIASVENQRMAAMARCTVLIV